MAKRTVMSQLDRRQMTRLARPRSPWARSSARVRRPMTDEVARSEGSPVTPATLLSKCGTGSGASSK
jgi:hypothetical protein